MFKKWNLLSLIPNIVLTFCIGLVGAGCLCTAFGLDVAPGNILLACAFWAIAMNVAMHLPKGNLIALGLIALWALHFWWRKYYQDLAALANVIFEFYSPAYGWTLPDIFSNFTDTNVTFAVASIAAICTMMAGICLQAGSSIGAILAAAIPLLPCLIVTDTVPDPLWIFAEFVVIALLLLTNQIRKIDQRQANRLIILLLVPVILVCCLLFAMNPQEGYDKASEKETFGERVLELLDKLPFVNVDENGQLSLDFGTLPTLGTLPSFGTLPPFGSMGTLPPNFSLPNFTVGPEILDIIRDQVSLENAGPRNPTSVKVMTVSTSYRGTLYLRERGYDLYTGTAWGSSDETQILYISPDYLDSNSILNITTLQQHTVFFHPYYPNADSMKLPGGYWENPGRQLTYNIPFAHLQTNWQTLWQSQQSTAISQIAEYEAYLQLTDYAQAQAQAFLDQLGITPETDVVTAANSIQNFVRNSARYDLNTRSMPKDAKDFAIWFLTESDTGYCVHFASAATVLLRAAGIPARYVEGYMAQISSATTQIGQDRAHAWVEYYVPGVGWVIMEPTPGDSSTPTPPETTVPTSPETTVPVPPETTEPTPPETTQPVPPETTVPVPPETTVPVPPVTTKPTPPATTTPPSTTAPPPSVPPTESTGSTDPTTEPSVPGTSSLESTVPGTSSPVVITPEPDRTGLWITLSAVMFLLAVVCALVGQWQLRLWLQQMWIHRGNTNQQALNMWPICRKLAKLRRQSAPMALRDLAWKAKFSQYTLTEEELQEFHGYMVRSVEHLKQRPWYLRIFYRVIFAAY